MDCGMNCIKYLLFVFNLLFAICGIILVTIGALVHVALYESYTQFVDDSYFSPSILVIVVGCIVFVISFFGCCGAIKENHCMVITFSVFVSLILIIEIAGVIAVYVLRGNIKNVINDKMNTSMNSYNETNPRDLVTIAWDDMQISLNCCGKDGYNDWINKGIKNGTNNYPVSCCKAEFRADQNCPAAESKLNQNGCLESLKTNLEDNATKLGGIGIGIAFVELVGVILACFLAYSIRGSYESV